MTTENKCTIISKPNELWEKYKDFNPFSFDEYVVHKHPMFNGVQFEFQINGFLVSVIQHDFSMKRKCSNHVWEMAVIDTELEDENAENIAWTPLSRFIKNYCDDNVCGYMTAEDIKKCLNAIFAYTGNEHLTGKSEDL